MKEKILITGAAGQLGMELTRALVNLHGADAVIASDINSKARVHFRYCHFIRIDVLDKGTLQRIIQKYQITQIYHLAAMLSAIGEKNPLATWELNVQGLINVLELGRHLPIDKIFWPSSIAVFGKRTQKIDTPQDGKLDPSTAYGMTKVAGEFWCNYYFKNYGVDVRSVRYPGLIGYKSKPGGGTTDYAVDIFHKAVSKRRYACFLKSDTYLPMMYMPDAIKASLDVMHALKANITIRTSYNISGMSFSPFDVYENIRKCYPDFKIQYTPDFRQAIADSWPQSINDSPARQDWAWRPEYHLETMTEDMIKHLKDQYEIQEV